MYPDVSGEECHRTVNGQLLETADDGAGDGGDLVRSMPCQTVICRAQVPKGTISVPDALSMRWPAYL